MISGGGGWGGLLQNRRTDFENSVIRIFKIKKKGLLTTFQLTRKPINCRNQSFGNSRSKKT